MRTSVAPTCTAVQVGFASNSHLTSAFHRRFGISPSACLKLKSRACCARWPAAASERRSAHRAWPRIDPALTIRSLPESMTRDRRASD
jgi:AraC-like DNA-binding protein